MPRSGVLLDLLAVKLSSLTLGVDAAVMLLRLDAGVYKGQGGG